MHLQFLCNSKAIDIITKLQMLAVARDNAHLGEDSSAKSCPESEGGSRCRHDRVGKLAGHSISQALHRGSAGLGCFYQPQNVSNGCSITTALGPHLYDMCSSVQISGPWVQGHSCCSAM